MIDALDVPGRYISLAIIIISGHLKDKEKLIEGFRQKLQDFEINMPEILDISLSREYL